MSATLSRSGLLISHASPERPEPLLSELSDEELLARFLQPTGRHSADAFGILVQRHGPMVMSACRHVLRTKEDAEDAFQATFMTLARKAETIRNQRSLAAWLHEVALRIAIRTRASAARRRDQEKQGAAHSKTAADGKQEDQVAVIELRPLLHEEVNRLPDKYRLPIILSYIEGRSNEEVAALLGWPVGTVKGRLFRARDLLRSRLTRRGVALSAAFILLALSDREGSAAELENSLVEETTRRCSSSRDAGSTNDRPSSSDSESPSSMRSSFKQEPARSQLQQGQRKSRSSTALFVVIAVLCVGFAISSFIMSDPLLSRRVRTGFFSLARGEWTKECR
jgi:RNA polymerase sigma factor (sigma-70 family)